jgi:hypothetical protein
MLARKSLLEATRWTRNVSGQNFTSCGQTHFGQALYRDTTSFVPEQALK